MSQNRFILASLFFCLSALVITGCGSESSSPAATPTPTTTVFQLFPSGYFTPGSSDSINLTGSDTSGGRYTGVVSRLTQSQTTFLGQSAVPLLVQLQLTNTANGSVISNIGTIYYSTSASDRHNLGYSDSASTTVSATTSAIPQTATIGNFGSVGAYTDNAGDVQTESWRLDDGSNGKAKIVELSTTRDQFGNLEYSSTTTTLIDTSGNAISTTLVVFYADLNITLTLSGS